MDWSAVDAELERASVPANGEPNSENTVFPGAVLLVGRGGEVLYHKAFGSRTLVPEKTPLKKDTVFDVASLTKVMVTTLLTMQFVDSGKIDVDRKLSTIFQTFGTHGKERITIKHLLSHCSGYPATVPYYKQISKADKGERAGIMTSRGAVDLIYNEIFRSKLENLPGRVSKYSDIGFILLGHVLEVISGGMQLDKLAHRVLIRPLELPSTGYIDLSKVKRGGISPVHDAIAATAKCPWRNKVLLGEVHDDNAWAMGGIAGHAGIFSNAIDIHRFATELIECWHGRGSLLSKDIVRKFWTRDDTVPTSTWALGWDTPDEKNSSAGRFFSRSAVGHLAFTGCSLWIDPERELDVILLSNRIHPNLDNQAIREFRPLIHDLVMSTLGYDS